MTFDYVAKWLKDIYTHADERFVQLLVEMLALHEHKLQDYGPVDTGNLVAAREFGLPAWLGILLRMNDKWARLKHFACHRELVNESFVDSLLDLANYSLLCLILYREETSRGQENESTAAGVLPEKSGEDDRARQAVAEGSSESGEDGSAQVRAEEEEEGDLLRDLTDLTLGASDGYAGSKPYWFRSTIDKALREYESRWAK